MHTRANAIYLYIYISIYLYVSLINFASCAGKNCIEFGRVSSTAVGVNTVTLELRIAQPLMYICITNQI